jgi:hypothetical protein
MKPEKLLKLAKQSIEKWEKNPFKLGNYPVVQVCSQKLIDKLEICPNVVGEYVGSSSKGHLYNFRAESIVNNLTEHVIILNDESK